MCRCPVPALDWRASKQIPSVVVRSYVGCSVVHLSERPWSTPPECLVCLEAFSKVACRRHFVTIFNPLQASFDGLLGTHEKEGLDRKINGMPVASDALLPCVPLGTFDPQMFGRETTQLVVRTMIITSVETDLLPDVIVL